MKKLRTVLVVPRREIAPLLITLVAALQQLGALAIHLILLQSLPRAPLASGHQSLTSVRVVRLAPSTCDEDCIRTAAKDGAMVVELY
jgi:hypothetical protein